MTNRNTHWWMVAAFSTIALVAITSEFGDEGGKEGNITDQTKETKWAVSAISIALALSGLTVLALLRLKDKFVDTPVEGGMVSAFAVAACLANDVKSLTHTQLTIDFLLLFIV